MNKKTIALAMIVRNEGVRLAECLDSVRSLVNEIVIVDTGSADNTVEIARRYTDKVFYYAWNNDFSAARNFALDQTNCEWILSLDADERLEGNGGDLRALVEQNEKEAFCLPLHAIQEQGNHRFDQFMVLRLFKHTYRFCGAIHEQIILDQVNALGFASSPIIWHAPIPSKERRIRRSRNIALLQAALKQEPDNPFLIYYCGVDWMGLGRMDKAIPCFERVLRCLSDQLLLFRTPALRYLIDCYKAQDDLDKAICLCLDESLRYPAYSDLFFEGGVLFELKGEYQIAANWFKEALQHGKPAPVFYHTDGTESYLSLSHLGYCLEKQGLFKQARECYVQALTANKQHQYPLYQLLQLDLSHHTAAAAWQAIQQGGFIEDISAAESAAGFFWEAGFPDLAFTCMTKVGSVTSETSIKYGIYSGHHQEAISGIDKLRAEQKLGTALAVDEIVAFLIAQDLRTAKARALNLWRCVEARSAAWAMLNLTRMLEKGMLCGTPESYRYNEVTQVLMDILEKCWRSRVEHVQTQATITNIITNIMNLLLLHPQSAMLLTSYLQEKAEHVRRRLKYNFEAVKGLYA